MAKAKTNKPAAAAVAALAAAAAPVIAADAAKLLEIPVPENKGETVTTPAAAVALDEPPVIAADAANLLEIPVPENESGPVTSPASEAVLDVQPDLVINGAYRVAGVPQKGFYRAGRHWPREGLDVARSDFSYDQWAALEAEPNITIKPL